MKVAPVQPELLDDKGRGRTTTEIRPVIFSLTPKFADSDFVIERSLVSPKVVDILQDVGVIFVKRILAIQKQSGYAFSASYMSPCEQARHRDYDSIRPTTGRR